MRSVLQDLIFEPRDPRDEPVRDAQRAAHGKAARAHTPRSRHRELPLPDRPDPIALLEEQAHGRVLELVPVRYARMMVSPFTFYRGAAVVMASDLARTPSSGLRVQLCGDAHLLNFGLFGTPERELVFDVNDFDETLPGPFEWDVKRLAASIEIAGRGNGYSKDDRRANVRDAVRCYRDTMAELATMGNLDVWYARLAIEEVLDTFANLMTRRQRRMTSREIEKTELQDSVRELAKLTQGDGVARRIVSRPPLLVPLRDLLDKVECAAAEARMGAMFDVYARSLAHDRRRLFEQFRFVELARKVVGVGSVGTRCWIALFAGVDNDDPLFLQIKEADASVLERFLGTSEYTQHGERVVAGQRLMQAASDLLLGHGRAAGFDGAERDFYVRQLRDWKGSMSVEELRPEGLSLYGRMCGWSLARAHARSGDRVAIAGYLGAGANFDDALVAFAEAYADQNERDHDQFLRHLRSRRLPAKAAA